MGDVWTLKQESVEHLTVTGHGLVEVGASVRVVPLERAEKAEKRLEEADLRNQLLLKHGNEVAVERDEVEAREQVLEASLKLIASCGSYVAGDVVSVARRALASKGTPEEAS